MKQMEKKNEIVGMKNHLLMSVVKKRLRLVHHFTRQELWECVGCILLDVTYVIITHKRWSEITRAVGNSITTKLHIDAYWDTDIYKL